MQQYILKRLLAMIPTVVAVSLIVFAMLHLVPGDPARVVGGMDAGDVEIQAIRERLGLNQPLWEQYGRWIAGIVTGRWGTSIISGQPVLPYIMSRFINTAELALAGMTVAIIGGVAVGVVSAVYFRTAVDYVSMALATLGITIPNFALGLLLSLIFAVYLGWLPASGNESLRHFILPTLTVSTLSTALIARVTRSSLLEVLNLDYVRTAKAKGLGTRSVVYKHALRNALLPVVTVIGIQFGTMLAGAVVTETVFHWPGLGRLVVSAIFTRDFPLIQGSLLLIALAFLLINFLVDILYAFIDPRIEYR